MEEALTETSVTANAHSSPAVELVVTQLTSLQKPHPPINYFTGTQQQIGLNLETVTKNGILSPRFVPSLQKANENPCITT